MIGSLHQLVAQWKHERPDVNISAFTIAAAITQIDNHMEEAFRQLSQTRFGIGVGDMRILLALRRHGPANPQRPTDLFRSLLISSGAVTKQVDRLVKKRLVKRMPDPDYQRGRLITLTKHGKDVADAAIEAVCGSKTSIGRAISGLSLTEQAAGISFLQRLLTEFDAVEQT
jgi:DNA-binding MarR family transcriptional regulator